MDDSAKGANKYVDDDADVPKFHLVVDSEHKGKSLPLYSFRFPHMRCFHLNWVGFFITFFSAYAAAPIVEIIRDDLNLRQYQGQCCWLPLDPAAAQLGNTSIHYQVLPLTLPSCAANMAGVVTTAGTVFARILMGNVCDMYGPRLGKYLWLSLPRGAHMLCHTGSRLSPLQSLTVHPVRRLCGLPVLLSHVCGCDVSGGELSSLHLHASGHRLWPGHLRGQPVLDQRYVHPQHCGHCQRCCWRLGKCR